MISESCRALCVEKLRRKRTAIEEEMTEQSINLASIRGQEHDKKSGGYVADVERAQSILNAKFASLKVINFRKEAFEKGTLSGLCRRCKTPIPESELEDNPLRDLCVKCQIEENGRRR